MTVIGSLAYILLPKGAFNGTLSPQELFQEASSPHRLLPLMVQQGIMPDGSHHGIVDIAHPAVQSQVPLTIVNSTAYELLLAAQYSATTAPCCFENVLDSVQVFDIALPCRDADCCIPAESVLTSLRPEIRFAAGMAVPTGPPVGHPLSQSTYAFTQTFALIGSRPGESDEVTARAGGSDLFTTPGSDRVPVTMSVTAPKRVPVSVRMVPQQKAIFDEEDSVLGPQQVGREAYIRSASLHLPFLAALHRSAGQPTSNATMIVLIPQHQVVSYPSQPLCSRFPVMSSAPTSLSPGIKIYVHQVPAPPLCGNAICCRYMLYDQFDCSAVSFTLNEQPSIQVRMQLRTANSKTSFPCSGTYDPSSGGDCAAVIPRSLIPVALSTPAQIWLEVVRQGVVIADAHSDVMLIGRPSQPLPSPRTGFGFGPYRFLYPGEAAVFPFFANTNGEEAQEFMLHVKFDSTVFEFVNNFDLATGWKVRFAALVVLVACPRRMIRSVSILVLLLLLLHLL
jgi:hypothetical protein